MSLQAVPKNQNNQTADRKVMDCRDFPSQSNCSLTIAGKEDEVIRAAVEHAISVHGHQDSPELREQIRRSLKDEGLSRKTDLGSGGETGPLHQIA